MGIFDTFKRRAESAPKRDISKPDSATTTASKTGLQLLFAAPFSPSVEDFTRSLRAYDPSLRAATASLIEAGDGSGLGEVSFGEHAVQIVVFGFPMPDEPVEACLAPSHFDAKFKTQARTQQAHALLWYRGASQNVSQQYVALALVAGALCGYGALAVLNETARTALPALLFTSDSGPNPAELLRTLPPLYLFAGFVKYEIEGQNGVWMRTHGLQLWELPNLATRVESHARGSEIFEIFSNLIAYMLAKGPILCAGHTMQIGEDTHMKLRAPGPGEAQLRDENELLIADFIRADQSNPFVFPQ